MCSYDEAREALNSFTQKNGIAIDNPFDNKDCSKLARLIDCLLTDVKFSQKEPNEKEVLFEAIKLLINSMIPANNQDCSKEQPPLVNFKETFNIEDNSFSSRLQQIAAVIIAVISSIVFGIMLTLCALAAGLNVLATDPKTALSLPFEFMWHGPIYGFNAGKHFVLGTPKSIVQLVTDMNGPPRKKTNFTFFSFAMPRNENCDTAPSKTVIL